MKKFFAIIILAATLLTMFAGCGKKEPEVTTPAGITCEEVLNNLQSLLAPAADQYEMTVQAKVPLDDGVTSQPIDITDTLRGHSYHISIYFTPAKGVDMFSIRADRSAYSKLDFALWSHYLYDSLNLTGMEAQAFYDSFGLLSDAPDGHMQEGEWSLMAYTTDAFSTFSGMIDG